jgi:glycosyltransferase involved in cell wall biosynthesis
MHIDLWKPNNYIVLKISLILPVYNPADGWADVVLGKSSELRALYPDIKFETIVVNDGSVNSNFADGKSKLRDDTVNLIEYSPNKGKGEALRSGVVASSGDLVIYTDIDFPYTIDSMSDVIRSLRDDGQNVVIGIKDRSYYDHVPPLRRVISRAFRFFVRRLLHIPTDDTQCGLKGFDQKGKELFLRTTINRYLFDLEFIFLAAHDKTIKLKTQEIKLRQDVKFRKMNLAIIGREAWNFLKILIRSYVG